MAKGPDYEVTAPQLSLGDLVAALQALKGTDEETLKKQAELQAQAIAALNPRENRQSPEVSVFNPEGDITAPRPELKCRMTWLGTHLDKTTLKKEEIQLLNAVERVGEYTFQRTDDTPEKLTVTGEKDANGQWQRLQFVFDARGDKKHNLPSMTAILRTIVTQQELAAA